MIEMVITVVMGFAVLGVQYLVFRQGRKDLLDFATLLAQRLDQDAANQAKHLLSIEQGLDELCTASDAHDDNNEVSHADTLREVKRAVEQFDRRADEFRDHAVALKVHAQELLDRSEAHAITPRQVVTRG